MVSKQDLELFRIRIISDLQKILEANLVQTKEEFDWLRSKAIPKMTDISPTTLQNLSITKKYAIKRL